MDHFPSVVICGIWDYSDTHKNDVCSCHRRCICNRNHRTDTEESFAVSLSLSEVSETERLVARQEELAETHKALSRDGSRCIVVLHGLGGIGKNTRGLIVYDNCDNPKLPGNTAHTAVDLRRFLPEAYHGLILSTTRSSQVKSVVVSESKNLEDVRDSLEILSSTSGQGQ